MSSENKEQLNKIAQEKLGKSFDECTPEERLSVGGTLGGERRKEEMAEAAGGDASKAYAEMGAKGGAARAEEAGKGEDK
jgi:hypothetical protein